MSSKTKGSEEAGIKLDEDEKEVVERESALPVQIIYEIVRREGEEELKRPNQSLALSGLAAGLAIGFSVLCEAMLLAHLPDEPWRPLVDNFGYTASASCWSYWHGCSCSPRTPLPSSCRSC